VQGTDHAVWHIWYAGGWSHWESLGGQSTADPAITSAAVGRLDAFVKGTDNQLYHLWFSGGKWHGWEALQGGLTTGPAATALGPSEIDVVAAGAANEPERLVYKGGWQLWQPLGGATPQPPSVVPFSGGEAVLVTGTDAGLWFGAVSTAGTPQVAGVVPATQAAGVSAARTL
jgi:hypothetical protein